MLSSLPFWNKPQNRPNRSQIGSLKNGRIVPHTHQKTLCKRKAIIKLCKPTANEPKFYNVEWVNSKQDLAAIAQGIAQSGRGTLCLYGTLQVLANLPTLHGLPNKPTNVWITNVHQLLLNKYVGETEQRIAPHSKKHKRKMRYWWRSGQLFAR